MTIKVAINGFGRIGRMVFRASYDDSEIEYVALNDPGDIETNVHLLKYDSVHKRFNGEVKHDKDHIIINGKKIVKFCEREPEKLPWGKLGVDVVLECTGVFLTRELASKHLKAGAKKVLLSAPAKDDSIKTIVKGINEHDIKSDDTIVSNASCTTNCFAPICKVLSDNFGIEKGFMVTTHAYTADQRVVDSAHKDLRRARHAGINIIPTTSGAAKAVMKVVPEVGNKIHASAMRVPVADGSVIYVACDLKKETNAKEVNHLFKNVASHHLKGVIEYTQDPIVSSDVVGNPHSAVFDSLSTEVEGNMVKIVAWYDNEWGYSSRMVDLIKCIAK